MRLSNQRTCALVSQAYQAWQMELFQVDCRTKGQQSLMKPSDGPGLCLHKQGRALAKRRVLGHWRGVGAITPWLARRIPAREKLQPSQISKTNTTGPPLPTQPSCLCLSGRAFCQSEQSANSPVYLLRWRHRAVRVLLPVWCPAVHATDRCQQAGFCEVVHPATTAQARNQEECLIPGPSC